jgi:acetoin utilization deacetylase AcuC-like enzyme
VLIISSARFAEHTPPPGHPERPERARVFDEVAASWRAKGATIREPRPATREELLSVHDHSYLDEIAATSGKAALLDPDTFTSPESYEVALLAAGAAIDAARHAHRTRERAIALVRPPGHHAEPNRAMGFCLFNNIAIAAALLRADGLSRVAIVDIDVHHGNGTQTAFYSDPTVLYISTHQHPYYPGTGDADETGAGAGKGFTLNVPMTAGGTDAVFDQVYTTIVLPALEKFRPDIVLVSAGFDAHEDDPLGGMRVTTAGYGRVVALLEHSATRLCEGRIAYVTEGGYDLDALRACLDATIEEHPISW